MTTASARGRVPAIPHRSMCVAQGGRPKAKPPVKLRTLATTARRSPVQPSPAGRQPGWLPMLRPAPRAVACPQSRFPPTQVFPSATDAPDQQQRQRSSTRGARAGPQRPPRCRQRLSRHRGSPNRWMVIPSTKRCGQGSAGAGDRCRPARASLRVWAHCWTGSQHRKPPQTAPCRRLKT